jgi:hypothetical protein
MAVAVITYVELKKAIRIALRSRLEAITRTPPDGERPFLAD